MTSTIEFYVADFGATLYPLQMNRFMIQVNSKELSEYIYQRVINTSCPGDSFLAQQRVYATKPKGHLRRTVKLDPVAEYFIYDIVYRNKSIFRPEVSNTRRSFGYRFKDGSRIPVHLAYAEYKKQLRECARKYKHNIQFDVASYFNSIYHHDITHWFSSKDSVTEVDSRAFGQFFREINSGRSIDFLPHGIYPCKMIGNEFLKFVELSGLLKSGQIVRFMDDFTLFDDNPGIVQQDFIRIQQLLGQVALNINPSKTSFDNAVGDIKETLSKIRVSLKEIVTEYEEVPTESGVEMIETDVVVEKRLSADQVEALLNLLKDDKLEESDADLILGFLRSHSDSLLEQMPLLLARFPNLIKHIYTVCSGISDKNGLVAVIRDYLNTNSNFLEYQLFWLGAIVEDYLMGHGDYGRVLLKLYELTPDLKIARAKVLETAEQGFGLKEIRNDYLKTGQSDWLSWASAVGSRTLKPAERNYALEYFSKASYLNYLVASCVKKL